MVYAIVLFLLGILAASSVIVKNKPEAKELIDKLVSIQGWLGVVGFVWGVWGLIQAILNIKLMGSVFVWWVTWVAMSSLSAALGLLLGFGLIAKYVLSKNEEALAKGEALRQKLATIQIPLGFAGIGVAIWGILKVTVL